MSDAVAGPSVAAPTPTGLIPPPAIAALLARPAPPEAAAWAGPPVPSLGVGQPGKVGWADLRASGAGGATRLVAAEARVPLQVGRVHAWSDVAGDLPVLYLTMPTGGLVQGDRVAVRVVAEQGARLRLTTPAATKVYGMHTDHALQAVDLTARSGAWLEWWPEPTIPYRGARYHQATTLTAETGAVLLWGEVLLPGRLARGERHAYDWLVLEVAAWVGDGRLVAADRQCFIPTRGPLDAPGRLRAWPVLASALLLAPGRDLTALLAALGPSLDAADDALAGASLLTEGQGIVVRALAASGARASDLLAHVVCLVRAHLATPGGGVAAEA